MASSASGQDEPNRALWLVTRAGKMESSCPLGTTRCIPQANFPQKPYNKSCIDQVCSVKMASYWPRSFFASLWTSTLVSVHKHAKKELGQYLAILTSHLVNNPYILIVLELQCLFNLDLGGNFKGKCDMCCWFDKRVHICVHNRHFYISVVRSFLYIEAFRTRIKQDRSLCSTWFYHF